MSALRQCMDQLRSPVVFGAAAALITLTLIACAPEPKRTLQMNLSPGQSFVLDMQLDQMMEVSVAYGAPQSLEGGQTIRFRFTTEDTDAEGNARLAVHVEEARFRGLGRPIGPVLTGKDFAVVLSPTGEVVRFEDTDALREAARRELIVRPTAGSTPAARQRLQKGYMRFFSDGNLEALLEPIFNIWPSVPVTVGDRWRTSGPYWPAHDVTIESEFQLVSWELGEAEIAVKRTYRHAEQEPLIDYSGSGSGNITVSGVEGMLRRYEESRNLYGRQLPAARDSDVTQVDLTQDLFVEVYAR